MMLYYQEKKIISASVFVFGLFYCCYSDTSQESDSLVLKNSCTCFGGTLTYECTVIGSYFGNTLWRGSAFNCSLREIILQHLQFPESAYGECNYGFIAGKSLRVDNRTYYTSQLNVTIIPDVIDKSIECYYDGNTGRKQIVGSLNITLTSDQFGPPKFNVSEPISHTLNALIFTWSPVAPDCPAIHYNIRASNCGSCPTTTNHTTVTCTDIPTNGAICAFAVQTIICGNNFGQSSDTIHIALIDNGDSSDNVLASSVFTGAIVSATLLGGIIGSCITLFITAIIQRKVKIKCAAKPESSNRLYEDVHHEPKQSSSAVIDTRKNVAYGQVTS